MISLFLLVSMALMTKGTSLSRLPVELGNTNSRIIGGEDAALGEIPYQISLKYKQSNKHFCGGSVINNQHILTAAHCVIRRDPNTVIVYAGSHNINKGGLVFNPHSFKVHENYAPGNLTNDLAIIKLKEIMKFSDNLKPIEISTEDIGTGIPVRMSGFGYFKYPELITPIILQKLTRPTVSTGECKNAHRASGAPGKGISENSLCTSTEAQTYFARAEGKGACMGDSGGPVVKDDKQVGVISWGAPCATGIPDVHVRLAKYLDWISANKDN